MNWPSDSTFPLTLVFWSCRLFPAVPPPTPEFKVAISASITASGDLIVEIDGQEVNTTQDLAHVMNNHRSGDFVTIVYYHGRKRMTARVKLDEARSGGQT